MSHELPDPLEIKFTPDQIKAINDYETSLQSLAENSELPVHEGCSTSQKPKGVEVELQFSVEGDHLEVEAQVSGFCQTAKNCHSLWTFNLKTNSWDQYKSPIREFEIKDFKFPTDLLDTDDLPRFK